MVELELCLDPAVAPLVVEEYLGRGPDDFRLVTGLYDVQAGLFVLCWGDAADDKYGSDLVHGRLPLYS